MGSVGTTLWAEARGRRWERASLLGRLPRRGVRFVDVAVRAAGVRAATQGEDPAPDGHDPEAVPGRGHVRAGGQVSEAGSYSSFSG